MCFLPPVHHIWCSVTPGPCFRCVSARIHESSDVSVAATSFFLCLEAEQTSALQPAGSSLTIGGSSQEATETPVSVNILGIQDEGWKVGGGHPLACETQQLKVLYRSFYNKGYLNKGSLNIKRLLLIKEHQISQIKEFSTFLCMGKWKSLDSLKSFFSCISAISWSLPCVFHILSSSG